MINGVRHSAIELTNLQSGSNNPALAVYAAKTCQAVTDAQRVAEILRKKDEISR